MTPIPSSFTVLPSYLYLFSVLTLTPTVGFPFLLYKKGSEWPLRPQCILVERGFFNLPMNDQDRVPLYSINSISSQQVMKKERNINQEIN